MYKYIKHEISLLEALLINLFMLYGRAHICASSLSPDFLIIKIGMTKEVPYKCDV